MGVAQKRDGSRAEKKKVVCTRSIGDLVKVDPRAHLSQIKTLPTATIKRPSVLVGMLQQFLCIDNHFKSSHERNRSNGHLSSEDVANSFPALSIRP